MSQPARRVSIAECNVEQRLVFFDANVIFDAIWRRERADELLTQVEPRLRHVSSIQRYEVAFAHKGLAASTLEENGVWMTDHNLTPVSLNERALRRFERFFGVEAQRVRRRTDLADALLAAQCLALLDEGHAIAVATRDADDYERIPLDLVSDFL